MIGSWLDVRRHPLRAGLLWAVLFVPLSTLIDLLFGGTFSERQIMVMAVLAIPCGIFWGYAMQFVSKRSPPRAR
jgi:hypothetical protein